MTETVYNIYNWFVCKIYGEPESYKIEESIVLETSLIYNVKLTKEWLILKYGNLYKSFKPIYSIQSNANDKVNDNYEIGKDESQDNEDINSAKERYKILKKPFQYKRTYDEERYLLENNWLDFDERVEWDATADHPKIVAYIKNDYVSLVDSKLSPPQQVVIKLFE